MATAEDISNLDFSIESRRDVAVAVLGLVGLVVVAALTLAPLYAFHALGTVLGVGHPTAFGLGIYVLVAAYYFGEVL